MHVHTENVQCTILEYILCTCHEFSVHSRNIPHVYIMNAHYTFLECTLCTYNECTLHIVGIYPMYIPRMYIAYFQNIPMYVLWTSYVHTSGNYFTYIEYALYILFTFFVYTQITKYPYMYIHRTYIGCLNVYWAVSKSKYFSRYFIFYPDMHTFLSIRYILFLEVLTYP